MCFGDLIGQKRIFLELIDLRVSLVIHLVLGLLGPRDVIHLLLPLTFLGFLDLLGRMAVQIYVHQIPSLVRIVLQSDGLLHDGSADTARPFGRFGRQVSGHPEVADDGLVLTPTGPDQDVLGLQVSVNDLSLLQVHTGQ